MISSSRSETLKRTRRTSNNFFFFSLLFFFSVPRIIRLVIVFFFCFSLQSNLDVYDTSSAEVVVVVGLRLSLRRFGFFLPAGAFGAAETTMLCISSTSVPSPMSSSSPSLVTPSSALASLGGFLAGKICTTFFFFLRIEFGLGAFSFFAGFAGLAASRTFFSSSRGSVFLVSIYDRKKTIVYWKKGKKKSDDTSLAVRIDTAEGGSSRSVLSCRYRMGTPAI